MLVAHDSNSKEFEEEMRSGLKTMDAPQSSLVIANDPPPSRKFQISSEKLGQYFSAYFVPILASEHPCDKLETPKIGIDEDKSGSAENHSMVQSPTIPHPPFTQGGRKDSQPFNNFVNIDQCKNYIEWLSWCFVEFTLFELCIIFALHALRWYKVNGQYGRLYNWTRWLVDVSLPSWLDHLVTIYGAISSLKHGL